MKYFILLLSLLLTPVLANAQMLGYYSSPYDFMYEEAYNNFDLDKALDFSVNRLKDTLTQDPQNLVGLEYTGDASGNDEAAFDGLTITDTRVAQYGASFSYNLVHNDWDKAYYYYNPDRMFDRRYEQNEIDTETSVNNATDAKGVTDALKLWLDNPASAPMSISPDLNENINIVLISGCQNAIRALHARVNDITENLNAAQDLLKGE